MELVLVYYRNRFSANLGEKLKNLTTPQAILCRLGLIALAIVVSSYSPSAIVKEARADAGWLKNLNYIIDDGNSQVVTALNDISKNIRLYCGN